MPFKLSQLAFLLMVLFASCNKPANNQSSIANDSTLFLNDSSMLSENADLVAFRAYIQQLDSTDAKSMELSMNEFKRIFSNKSTGLCDSAYCIYQELIDTLELKLNDNLLNDTTDYLPLFTNTTVSKKLKLAKAELLKYGFKYAVSEGQVYIEQDRSYLIKNLMPLFSEPMKAYLQQIEKENREGFIDDAGIVIQPKQHVDRIIWYEQFIAENPDFMLIKNCKSYKKAYQTYLFTGIHNTSLFEDEEKMVLSSYFVAAYSYVSKVYPQSELALLVEPFRLAIEQKQLSVVEDLLKKYTIKGLIFSQGI
jgi:hypothetical protein